MVEIVLTAVLFLQAPVAASERVYYVTDFSYDRLDCQTGKKIAKETVPTGTVVSIVSEGDKRLRVLEVALGRETCIKAREKDLIEASPIALPDGTVASFIDSRNPVDPPQVRAPASRAPLSLSGSDDPDIMLPEVLLLFAVASDGAVHGCRVLRSSRSTGWDNWARAVACGATYFPARQHNQLVAVTVVQRVPVGRR